MAIQVRNKRKLDLNSTSMADLVFLLLIFFMLTSTLVSPNAIKLLLPSSNSKTMAKQTVTVYVDKNQKYYLGEKPVSIKQLRDGLADELAMTTEGSVVLRTDVSVPVQNIVEIIDAVNDINDKSNSRHKVILATKPKK
ncbi:MAG: biopolymer transporter ExbD [Bacteroidales bacterium]|nr:biopolymer transporter ExbD [Bacteroidales bacterium]